MPRLRKSEKNDGLRSEELNKSHERSRTSPRLKMIEDSSESDEDYQPQDHSESSSPDSPGGDISREEVDQLLRESTRPLRGYTSSSHHRSDYREVFETSWSSPDSHLNDDFSPRNSCSNSFNDSYAGQHEKNNRSRPRAKSYTKDTKTCDSNLPSSRVCIVCIAMVSVVICMNYFGGSEAKPALKNYQWGPSFSDYKKRLLSIRDMFRAQEKQLWSRLLTAGEAQFESYPQRPGVAVIAYSGNDVTARCITSFVGEESKNMFNFDEVLRVPNRLLTNSKLELDTLLRGNFQRGVRVAIFPNLEKFDKDALLLMHDYCDDQDAPFKDVMLLFEAHVPSGVKEARGVEDFLAERFGAIVGEDEAGALVSRVLRNIALVREETKENRDHIGCPL